MSAGSEEQQAVRVLALGEQIHLRSPLTLAVPNHPNRLGVQSPLSLRIYSTCCRCESVHAAFPAVAENPLELRRLLLSWPKEQEMDSFILVNEAREAEFQMSKFDFINQ